MSDYLSRILIGAMSIGVIASILFAVSQFSSLNDAQIALDNAETELTQAVENASVMQTSQAEEIANSEATSADLSNRVSDANVAGTESHLALDSANETATQQAVELDDIYAISTQIADDAIELENTLQVTVTAVADEISNVQATSDANVEALMPLQTQSADLASIATEQSNQLDDAQSTEVILQASLTENANTIATQLSELDEAQVSLTENANTIATQASEINDAQEALNAIATSVSGIEAIELPESTEDPTPVEITEEAEATEDPTPVEITEEAEATEDPAPVEITEEAEATEESAPIEITEEVEATEESTPIEMTEEVEATEESAPIEMTEEVEVTEESAPVEMTEEVEATEESAPVEMTEETPIELAPVPENLILFEGEEFVMLAPEDFLSFDARRDRTDAIETFRGLGAPYSQALTTAINTLPSSVFLGFADVPNADGTIDQIIIIKQAIEAFTTMDAYLELITPTSRIDIVDRDVLMIDGQEVGRVLTEQAGARDVITHVLLYVYYDETSDSVYVIALSSIGDGMDERIAQYEAIGQSFELVD